MKNLTQLSICIISCLISACNTSSNKSQTELYAINDIEVKQEYLVGEENRREEVKSSKPTMPSSLKHKEIQYAIHVMSALDFVKRKGETPEVEDIDVLKKETVLFLEFESEGTNILESEQIQLSEEEVFQYVTSKISGDIEIEQEGELISPDGVLLDRSTRGTNKLRTILFFSTLNHEKEFLFKYKDQLFGAGEIKLSRP